MTDPPVSSPSLTAQMTLLFSLMLLVMVCVAFTSTVGSCNSSSFTDSTVDLQYELLCRTEDYEVRRYSSTRWISTDAEAYFLGVGAAMAFRRLYHYISGDNKEGVKFELTAPVLVEVPEERKMWEPAIYTLSFLLPSAYQERPPTPTNDKLYFSDMPDMDVYVRCYGGWMLSITSRLHAHLLTKALLRANAHYNHTHHYTVGYDSPLKLLNRHNEVWYVVEGDPVCGHNITSIPADAH
ncbi:heme-binding protein 2 isoform X2 [Xyrauchen texanus]|uniref:heme-binding protein 2 isoform X2 n=1 Tax=Xyrauchen texanus TaxID=154827 RepID=UPI00224197AB|nr:heme-binding protein 2 isoform X2 [Xyrauchen texanus]